MLILSRKAGDAIVIDGGIRIVVVQCDRGTVRIGIEAPPETTILRAELVDQVAAQNKRSTVRTEAATPLIGAGSVLTPRLPKK
jgi:carbon storage regulator